MSVRPTEPLTKRQRQVLDLLVRGCTNYKSRRTTRPRALSA